MQRRILTATIMLLAFGMMALLISWNARVKAQTSKKRQQAEKSYKKAERYEEELPDMAKRRAEFFYKQRAFPSGRFPVDWRLRALDYMRRNMPEFASRLPEIKPKELDENNATIYIGTGEGNFSGDSFFGMGILKSTNGGQTWTNLAAQTFVGRAFSKLIIDPRNPNTLYAAVCSAIGGISHDLNPELAQNGIYKSTDGGETWASVLTFNSSGAPLGFSAFDIVMDPTNSSVLYATLNRIGIYKTTDGGQKWALLGGGLPTANFSRIAIAVAKSNPNVLYASFGRLSDGDLLSIFRSINGGEDWFPLSRPLPSGFGNVCQCVYDNFLEVDPTNPDVVYFGGVGFYKSTNGGFTWRDISKYDLGLHADFHAMAFVPGDSNQFYVGNDGGIWFSPDGGNTYKNINNNLGITQFQSVSIHPTDPKVTLGGTQDNGTNLYGGSSVWQHVDDGDGGFTAIDQTNPSVMYHTYFNVPTFYTLARSDQGGQFGTWQLANNGLGGNDDVLFYAPFILDPNNQSTVYFGTSRLYRSTDQGRLWVTANSDPLTKGTPFAAISAIAVAPGAPKIIYTGSSDGALFATQDGGTIFVDATDKLPERYISDIVIDPNVPTTVYASLSGFGSGHVFKSITGGRNWQDISGNLPDVPANTLAINSLNPLNLFVGTDVGVFQTTNGGTNWRLVPGMPIVAVFDLAINTNLGILRAATHGRGIYEMKLSGGPLAPIGPAPIESGQTFHIAQNVSGRITSISVDPQNPATIYVGAAQGGLWRSTNAGQTWQPMTDSAPTLAVGATAVFADLDPPTIAVTAPNGDEKITAGSQFNIAWKSSDNIGVLRHDIALSTDGGATFPVTVATGLAGNAQSFLWSVPAVETTQARIRITAFDAANNQGVDTSDNNFSITVGDFALAITPSSQTVTSGSLSSFTVNVESLGGFVQPVNLSATVSPPGNSVTATLSSSTVTPGSSTTLTVSTVAGTPTSTFTITITGTGGQVARTRTATVTLNVVLPDFALLFDPAQVTVSRGQSGQFTVNINRIGGFSGNVTVTAPDTKPLKIKLTPPMQSTTGTSVSFIFKVKKKAPAGPQQLTFTGRDDSGRVRTGLLVLLIQ